MLNSNYFRASSFWEIYSAMDDSQALEFTDFAGSGLFGTNKQLKSIAAWSYQLRKSELNPTKEEVYFKTTGKKTYNRQLMNNYLSGLKQLLQGFIQITWMQEQAEVQQYVMADSYFKMGLYHRFEKIVTSSKKTTIQAGPSEWFYKIKINQLEDEYFATQTKHREYNHLEPVVHQFSAYYFIETMRMYCELVNRKNLRNQPFDEHAMNQFLHYYHEVNYSKETPALLQVYAAILSFLREPDSHHTFLAYKSIIYQNITTFSVQTAREVCLYGQNQCIAHINRNNGAYLQELFDLYNLMLQANIMYEGPYMTQYTFKNYVTVALRLKAFQEAEQFIHDYKHKLHPLQQENAFHYNLAAVYFEAHQFKKSMIALNAIQINDPVYYLDSRCILLKIYFTQGDFDALASLYHSMRVYLLRLKQFSKKQSDLYRFLFLFTYKLSRLQNLVKIETKSTLIQKTDTLLQKINTTDIANKVWLQTIMNDFKTFLLNAER